MVNAACLVVFLYWQFEKHIANSMLNYLMCYHIRYNLRITVFYAEQSVIQSDYVVKLI